MLVLLGGFPIALVLAWAYELKPDGLHRDTAAQVDSGWKRNHRTDVAIGLIVVLSLAATTVIWSVHRAPEKSAQVTFATAAQPQAPPRSVAVLPFDNMSGDPKQKYFSEGVSSELIGLLARNPALHVAARTSSFFFEGKAQDVRAIAQKLNVRSILEGSIQSDSSHVHIEVSLVNAADGFQLWSQSYDRSLNDILAVQTEIAHSIAAALAPTLTGTPAKPIPKPAQIDPDIYRDYLRGQFYFDQRLNEGQTPASRDALNRSVALFRRVAAASPDFADGQAALARALSAVELGTELDGQINAALARALAIDPENPQALDMAILVASGNWD